MSGHELDKSTSSGSEEASITGKALPSQQNTSLSLFERLPPEIRNMVYSLCIVTNVALIRSPLKQLARRERPVSTFWSILLVNRNIRREASSWYYQSSTFIFGNASWGSTSIPNLQAMKSFLRIGEVSRVPKAQLSLIRTVIFEIHSRRRRVMDGRPVFGFEYILGDSEDVATLKKICRALLTHFTSLETVYFDYRSNGPWWPEYRDNTRLQGEEVIHALMDVLLQLSKHKTVTTISVFRDELIPLHKAAAKILEKTPEKSHLFEIQ